MVKLFSQFRLQKQTRPCIVLQEPTQPQGGNAQEVQTMTKTNLTKRELFDYLGSALLDVDFILKHSTKAYFEEVHSDAQDVEEWNRRYGTFYNTQLRALELATNQIIHAFKVLCTQKKNKLINFKLNDVLELCREIDTEDAEKSGYVYLDSFYEELQFKIKNVHRHWATNRRAA